MPDQERQYTDAERLDAFQALVQRDFNRNMPTILEPDWPCEQFLIRDFCDGLLDAAGGTPDAPEEEHATLVHETMKLLTSSPIWNQYFSATTIDHRKKLQTVANTICESAAQLSGYLDGRGCSDSHDQGHAAGLRWAKSKLHKVREALNFWR